MEFFNKVKAFPLPFANTICIMDSSISCMVAEKRGIEGNANAITVMQLTKGWEENKTNLEVKHPNTSPKVAATNTLTIKGKEKNIRQPQHYEEPKNIVNQKRLRHTGIHKWSP